MVPVTASIAAASASAELQLKLMQVRVHTAPREGGESRAQSAVRASWLRPESAVGSCPERRGAENYVVVGTCEHTSNSRAAQRALG